MTIDPITLEKIPGLIGPVVGFSLFVLAPIFFGVKEAIRNWGWHALWLIPKNLVLYAFYFMLLAAIMGAIGVVVAALFVGPPWMSME